MSSYRRMCVSYHSGRQIIDCCIIDRFVGAHKLSRLGDEDEPSHVRGVEVNLEFLRHQHWLTEMIQLGATLHSLELVVVNYDVSFQRALK